MKPTNRADAHLEDRMLELRIVKTLVVVFLAAVGAVFVSWIASLVVLGIGYTAYQARYYRRRVGVYTNNDLSARHDRLEYALFGFLGSLVVVFGAIELVFESGWSQGGFLSLPALDITDFGALLEDPIVPLAWLIAAVPVVVLSYTGLQFRKRLLVGINSKQAAVRATLWDVLGRLPIAVLWLAVLTVGPIYDLWKPVVDALETEADLTAQTTGEFILIFGENFAEVLIGAFGVSGVVFGSYLVVQSQKYGDGTVPEVLGYRGLWPARRDTHSVNVAVPLGAYGLFAAAVYITVGVEIAQVEALAAGAGVAVLVGADIQALTTRLLGSIPGEITERVDAVVVGLVAGALTVVGASQVLGGLSIATLLLYPMAAVPVAYAGHWLVGYRTATRIDDYSDRVTNDWNAFDESLVDRLFIYSDARDQRVRSAALRGLASSMQARNDRHSEALGLFVDAIESTETETVQAGFQGLGAALRYSQSKQTYDWLVSVGAVQSCLRALDSNDAQTRAYAAEATARALSLELTTTNNRRFGDAHIGRLQSIAENNTQYEPLLSSITEYFARLWYDVSSDSSVGQTNRELQTLLGGVLWMAEHSNEYTRTQAVFAVTNTRAPADEQRLSIALDNLESRNPESRYMAAHVVRSSVDQHLDRIDSDQVTPLLDDSSPAVRAIGAETVLAMVTFDPERGSTLLDRLILGLEDEQDTASRIEESLLQTVAKVDHDTILGHPTATETIVGYVTVSNGRVAKHAAELLSSLVESAPELSRESSLREAIESGLTHSHQAVRLACLKAAALVVKHSTQGNEQFGEGLGANLGQTGRHGVLAAVTLKEVVDANPQPGQQIRPELAQGLRNHTPIETETLPFLVSGSRVSDVVVEIVATVVAADPGCGETLIEPLVDIAAAADTSTTGSIVRTLAELSAEFPEQSQTAAETAANALETGQLGTRSDATQLLANVAAYHPDAVVPFVDTLVVATEDNSPRVRAPALDALRNVCTALPAAVEDDIHQLIGLLDDDSAVVRKRAATLISTVAERQPDIVDPAAETADRLRRLQRDPAVDVDPEQLQDASTAIQTGMAADDVESQDREEIWTPESGDEMGVSGDTEVFQPVGDSFDPSIDDELEDLDEEPPPQEGAAPEGTVDEAAAVGDSETAVGPNTDDNDDVTDSETVIQSGSDDHDVGDSETVVQSGSDDDDVGDSDTVIQPGSDDDDVGDSDTVIQPGGGEDDDVGDSETVIQPGGSEDEDDDVGDSDTVIQPGSDDDDDVGESNTAIKSSDEDDSDKH